MTSLSKLKKLKHLFLTAYSITSDDGFSELSNLSSLQLVLSLANDKEPMSPSNIGLLKSFKNLLSLELNNIKGVTDEGLNALTNLTQLRLHGTVWKGSLITDLGFKNLTNLKSLDLYLWYYCEPTLNIDKLVSRIPNLTNLEMHIDELLTDAGLRNLRNLRRLHIAHNKFVTNRSIGNLRKLTYLDISSNRKVTDSSISKLTSLEYLSIHERWTPAYLERRTINCSITFNSLMHLTKLTDLNLQFHKKLSSEITHHLTNLTRLTVVGDAYP
ncbi:MAG: hypothetical protein Hyperionvirus4_113 [Hyperionvirus sp.]|uniref:Leucine-rich repeat protein n=1 Tax=Hyperionvirus sp. TaxID=2487770 RepID=A0A3G5A7J6_9VIRU|nr:MAG: hypothetical protein Hyperionvirus4_113 [Hyperionvirus sp.]